MSLIKTSFLSLIATSVKMLSLLVINKVVAVTIGPSGIAMIGQYQNFSQVAMTAAQGGLNQGVIKYTAEYKSDEDKLSELFSTAIKTSLFCSAFIGFLSVAASSYLAEYFLKSNEYQYVFILFGVFLPLFVVNQVLLAILNGLKDLRLFISNNIIQSLYSLVATSLLVWFFGLNGAFIAMVTNQSVVLLILLWRIRGHAVIKFQKFRRRYSRDQLRALGSFTLMALTSAATVPISHLVIRNHIGETLGWEAAGYWQTMWYISTMYLMVITTALSIYYLPTLSAIHARIKLRREVLKGYAVVIPSITVITCLIYVMRFQILSMLFSEEFSATEVLFAWHLIGDVIKMACFLIGNVLIAKALVKAFIFKEIFITLLFTLLALKLINAEGLVGVSYAYAFSYLINFVFLVSYFLFYYSKLKE